MNIFKQKTKHRNMLHLSELISSNINLLIVVGAESSGTRFISDLISQHPKVTAHQSHQSHYDYFDRTWNYINKKETKEKILSSFPEKNDTIFLTRRSIPHSKSPGKPATSDDFPPLKKFLKYSIRKEFSPLVIITVRSFIPHIQSWAANRKSANNSLKKSFEIYRNAYSFILSEVTIMNIPYIYIPLEAFLLDKDLEINAFYNFIGLEKIKYKFDINTKVNRKYY